MALNGHLTWNCFRAAMPEVVMSGNMSLIRNSHAYLLGLSENQMSQGKSGCRLENIGKKERK